MGDVEKDNGEVNGVASLPGNRNPGSGELRAERNVRKGKGWKSLVSGQGYATTFLTQFEVLAGREWKILRRYVYIYFFHRSECRDGID